MSDPERFLSLVEALREAVATLARYRATLPRDRLLRDLDTQNMVLFALYRAIQCSVDLGQHLIAERSLSIPSTYREVFSVLGTAGAIDTELAGRMQGWGGLRNVIAHQYGSLDIDRVATALYEELGDLERFLGVMATLATTAPSGA